jgi:hypothetical protein
MDNKQSKLEERFFEEINKRYPNLETIGNLLKNGVDINTTDKRGDTALLYYLHNINADHKWYDNHVGYTETTTESIELVQENVPETDISVVKFLLESGVDPNIVNKYDVHCLLEAAYGFRSDIFQLLLNYGADINFRVYNEEYFCDWIILKLDECKEDCNDVAVTELSKMIQMIEDIKKK